MKSRWTLLFVGCGDVALRAAAQLRRRVRCYGLVRGPEQAAQARAAGIVPIRGDLDAWPSLSRLGFSPDVVFHFAPPPNNGDDDPRTRRALAAIHAGAWRVREKRASLPQRWVYISTTGVYGDCSGARIDETRSPNPTSARARRRVAAEAALRQAGGKRWRYRPLLPRMMVDRRVTVLRAPGIYAADRLPVDRVRAGTPAITAAEDSYSNHIHADDLARAAIAALFRGRPNRVVNAVDGVERKMGDWFDQVADAFGLPRPPRISRAQAQATVSPTLWSFLAESRRIDNRRLRQELRLQLDYPEPAVLLARINRAQGDSHE